MPTGLLPVAATTASDAYRIPRALSVRSPALEPSASLEELMLAVWLRCESPEAVAEADALVVVAVAVSGRRVTGIGEVVAFAVAYCEPLELDEDLSDSHLESEDMLLPSRPK